MYWAITDTIKKNTETGIDASKEVGLEVNAEYSHMLLPHLRMKEKS
jgi:hypothetical protein